MRWDGSRDDKTVPVTGRFLFGPGLAVDTVKPHRVAALVALVGACLALVADPGLAVAGYHDTALSPVLSIVGGLLLLAAAGMLAYRATRRRAGRQ